MLDALSVTLLSHSHEADLKLLSFKTALLLALASGKRVSEIHALSVHSALYPIYARGCRGAFET